MVAAAAAAATGDPAVVGCICPNGPPARRLRRSVSPPVPSPALQVGAIARESLPASHAEYATDASRVELARYFRRCFIGTGVVVAAAAAEGGASGLLAKQRYLRRLTIGAVVGFGCLRDGMLGVELDAVAAASGCVCMMLPKGPCIGTPVSDAFAVFFAHAGTVLLDAAAVWRAAAVLPPTPHARTPPCRDGCHHCGTRRGKVIGDHMPPNK